MYLSYITLVERAANTLLSLVNVHCTWPLTPCTALLEIVNQGSWTHIFMLGAWLVYEHKSLIIPWTLFESVRKLLRSSYLFTNPLRDNFMKVEHLDFCGISVFSFTKLGSWKLWINLSITLHFTLKLPLPANC